MGISFGSINSGLPKDIVQQLMNAERIPLEKMEARKVNINEKKKLVTELTKLVEDVRGVVASNNGEKSFRELKVTGRDDIMGVTIDKNAASTGSYQIELLELAQKSSALSSGFEDKDESYVGVGYIQYSLPDGTTRDIYVDSDHASLSGIASLINSDKSCGMQANVINDGSGSDTPWRLMVSLKETGAGQKAEFPYFYFVDGVDDFYLESEREAKNAKIKIDGFEIEVPDNKVKDLIPGLTFDLRKAMPGEEFTLSVTEDIEAISKKMTDLVEKINGVFRFIKTQNKLDEKSDTTKTLGGDILLQTLESRLRGEIFRDFPTEMGPMRFGQLGATFQKDGLLALDEKKFANIISGDYKQVAQYLTGMLTEEGYTQGFLDHLNGVLSDILRSPDGLLPTRNKGLQSNIDQIDRRISNKQRLLEQKEKNLKEKFSRLESTIANLQKQSAGLAALGAAPAAMPQLG